MPTTTANAINERFTHSNNRATYNGSVDRTFSVVALAALGSTNNNVLRLYVGKNGTAITTEYFGESTANSGGRAENAAASAIVALSQGDYVEIFASNETGPNNITAINLGVTIGEL